MRERLSAEAARLLRLRAQRLDPDRGAETVAEVVENVCGIQAQQKSAGRLSIRPRGRNPTTADVEQALYEERSIVRTWAMRGTLHFVASGDLPWLLALFGPLNVSRGPERRELAGMGLDDDACDRAVGVIRDALAESGSLSRVEIAARLERSAIDVDSESRAPYYLVRRAALLGVCCEAAPRNGTARYALLDEWVGESVDVEDPPEGDEALAELARRYLAAFGPATLEDFAVWCRLYKRDVRRAWKLIADERIEVRPEDDTGDDEPMAMLAERAERIEAAEAERSGSGRESLVRLLPYYDTYLLGYETDRRGVPAEFAKRVWPGSALIRPTVTVDGRTVGTWTLDRSRTIARLAVEPFGALDSAVESGIDAEVRDIGRFLDTEIEWRLAG